MGKNLAFFFLGIVFINLTYSQSRPSDEWVRRVSMRHRPDVLAISLNVNFTVVYDTYNCGLYKVWAGALQDGNETYVENRNNISHYVAQGTEYYSQADNDFFDFEAQLMSTNTAPNQVWSLAGAAVKAKFRGHRLINNKVTLKYEIVVNNQVIRIEESPEFVNGRTLSRQIHVTGLNPGQVITLDLRPTGSTGTTVNWNKQGVGSVSGQTFTQSQDGTTTLTGAF